MMTVLVSGGRRTVLRPEADSVAQLQQWVSDWSDLVEFEVIPVVSGKETAEALASRLPQEEEP